ncbi:hypothetical protein BT96DRAFT_886211 [Gymnopus androsaceus JB14]|uniref:Uncharacterized protein n=1 Tax=Gymnopus androsaceus JB14 TaxID=1447944 RepID=A0A6A4HCA0_9AGAR|nr:hypothetical protein BT96DRAFT_886211 [Gymnopus androsaceus JB14]
MSQYYLNPIHPPVKNTSHYTTLGGAICGGPGYAPTPLLFLVPNRTWVPQTPYRPSSSSSKWRMTVDQTDRLAPGQSSVAFDHNGYMRQGMKMTQLYGKGSYTLGQMMNGAGDRVLMSTGLGKIRLYVRWPGYDEWIRPIEINTSSGPITRADLAAAVALHVSRYFEAYYPMSNGPWRIAPSNGIRFDMLVLVSITNIFEDVWQADIAVDS